jgi:hypothetical protein
MNPSLKRSLLNGLVLVALSSFLSQVSIADPKTYTASELVMMHNDQSPGSVAFEVDWDHWNKGAEAFRVKAKIRGSKGSFPIEEQFSVSQDSNDPLAPLRTLKTKLETMSAADADALTQAAQDFKSDSQEIAARYQMEITASQGAISSKLKGCKETVSFSNLRFTATTYFPGYASKGIDLYQAGTLKQSMTEKDAQKLWTSLGEQIAKCPANDPQKAQLESARDRLAFDSPDLWSVTCDKNITRYHSDRNSRTWPHSATTCEKLLLRYFEKFDCHLAGESVIQCQPDGIDFKCRIRPTDRCQPALKLHNDSEAPECQKGFLERRLTFHGVKEILFCQKDDQQTQGNVARLKGKRTGKIHGEAGNAGSQGDPE